MRPERHSRRRPTGLLWSLTGVAVVAMTPFVWRTDDLPLQVAVVCALSAVAVRLGRLRLTRSRLDYGDMLAAASAMRLELDHVRIAAVHRHDVRSMVTITWSGARTVLLDADARPLATALHNGLTSAYTMTFDVDDHVAELLAHERGCGEVSVYAVVDLVAHPRGNLREHGVTVEQYDLTLPSWSVSEPRHRIPQPWDS